MNIKKPISATAKITIASLFIAFIGVLVQIFSGVPYPKVPPVFFILLIPAALLLFTVGDGYQLW